ncbi:MAG: tRNA guanosine(15) transglycosylase TgtA [Candidatus Thorarchaeota archaeon]
MDVFELRDRDGLARLGRLITRHGTVTTPLLMPVVHPGKSTVTAQELRSEFGFEMVIANSFIIRSRPEYRDVALERGIHALLDFNGPVMTDSGTFQMYYHSLPRETIDPIEIVRFQRSIGTDIGTILDVFSRPDAGREKIEEDVRTSVERARRSVGEKGDMLLAGTVQGGAYTDLREACARELASMDFDLHPIGGAVPLMESYRYSDIVRVVLAAKRNLPANRPVHLFGCGHPMFLALAVALGCDLFDSASYAKFAEDGRLLLPSGTVHLDDLNEMPCECKICSSTTPEEIRRLERDQREDMITRHNLYVMAAEMRRVRQAVREEKILELAALRARSHPRLIEALMQLLNHADQIEAEDPVGKTASVFYTGPETALHPSLYRFHKRVLERYPYLETDTLLLVPDMGYVPFSESNPTIESLAGTHTPEELIVVYVTPIGVVPWEYGQVYPAQQCVFGRMLDTDTLDTVARRTSQFVDTVTCRRVVWVQREHVVDSVRQRMKWSVEPDTISPSDLSKDLVPEAEGREKLAVERTLKALFRYQWGVDITRAIPIEQMRCEFSRRTGKMRHLFHGEELLFTIVPTTGLMTPTVRGAQVLLDAGIGDDYRVVVSDEAAPFIRQGKSVIAKFVMRAGTDLRPGEEVLILDQDGNLLGTGPALLSGREMLTFKRGVAVNTRHQQRQQPAMSDA